MVFKSRRELNGEIDKNINTEGRVKSGKLMTKRELKDRELVLLARKIKPLLAEAIGVSAKVIRDNGASHASQLKASALLISVYQQLVRDLYNGTEDDADVQSSTEIQEQKPLFSLTMLEPEDSK